MKKSLPHLFICLLVIAGCRPSTSSRPSPNIVEDRKEYIADLDLDEIKKRGYLVAIMDNSSTGLFVYKGKTMGYEYELLKLFCDVHDIQLRFNVTKSLKEAFNN